MQIINKLAEPHGSLGYRPLAPQGMISSNQDKVFEGRDISLF